MTDRDDMRLTNPRLMVMLGDGTNVVAQANNADLVRWDFTRSKHKWPSVQEAPFLWLTFIAWAALRRTKQIDAAVTWETFSESVIQVSDLSDPDPTGPDSVDPTREGAEPDSSAQ